MWKRNLSRMTLAAACGIASVAFVGCVEERTDIPASAQVMSSGNDKLTFTATEPGSVIVEDANNQSIAYRGRLTTGDTIVVDPAQNAVIVNSTIVADKALHGGDQYKILFTDVDAQGNPI